MIVWRFSGKCLPLQQTTKNKTKMRKRLFVLSMLACFVIGARAAESGLNKKQFGKYWRVESEAPDYRVTFHGDTCELLSPKGLTLWRKEKMKAGMTVEYDALVVDVASDPQAKDLWARAAWRSGIFVRCYTLQMYYLGFGGNHNTTTRFRRYNGDEAGVENAQKRPAILKEYTDAAHLLKANHWYHWKIESKQGHTRIFVDGECIVDYLDPEPLEEGWFGFRTTLSRTRITNFKSYDTPVLSYKTSGVPLHWIGAVPVFSRESRCSGLSGRIPIEFGVPFAQGELKDVSQLTLSEGIPTDAWVTASWPDGSVKWAGLSAVVPADAKQLKVQQKPKSKKQKVAGGLVIDDGAGQLVINTGRLKAYLSKSGNCLIDSLCLDGKRVGGQACLVASTAEGDFRSVIRSMSVERSGMVRTVVKVEGSHRSATGREWLPFTVRLYFYAGSEQIRLAHTFLYDGDEKRDMITSLGVRFKVPMRDEVYNRHIAFATEDGGVWSEPVQPLDGRRDLRIGEKGNRRNLQAEQMAGQRVPAYKEFDKQNQHLLDHWAQWDGYRLSQLTDNSFSIRKRATDVSPWIGTFTGGRASGYAFVGDVSGGLGVGLKDFWQSYPSTIQVDKARSSEAELTMWLWSPEAEEMNLCHYDTIAHDLIASYEDVQKGMSSPYGIARTNILWLLPSDGYHGKADFSTTASSVMSDARLLPTPEYLYEKRAFGIWSLPKSGKVEARLSQYIDFYQKAIEQNKWYGFWNYGDMMHAYDPERHEWRYDVGGFAWDNTELATPMWLWYNFLRTGRSDIWQMAEAMTRHCSEVDTYHIGPFAPLGSRHNVTHWGCGAKEARISQAAFDRFYYYLTTDERTGDLMREQTDADTLLYHLDPMRLAEPISKYPCSAPARLRVGPDWLAYAGNWMTEWERFGTTKYRDKIVAGMESIAELPDGIFTGNLAKGYDPATGRLSYDGDPNLRKTNHLLTIMGGFELMNELMFNVQCPMFNNCWADFARRYKQMAFEVQGSTFPVRRLEAYAAWLDRDATRAKNTWQALWGQADNDLFLSDKARQLLPPEVPAPLDELDGVSTNNAALWSLDAIYMLEVLP